MENRNKLYRLFFPPGVSSVECIGTTCLNQLLFLYGGAKKKRPIKGLGMVGSSACAAGHNASALAVVMGVIAVGGC